jgi:hypothetical protein
MKYLLTILLFLAYSSAYGYELSFDIGLSTYHFQSAPSHLSKGYNSDHEGFGMSYKEGTNLIHLGRYTNTYFNKSTYLTYAKFISDNTYVGLTVADGYGNQKAAILGCCIVTPMLGYGMSVTSKYSVDLVMNPAFIGFRQSFKH